MSTLAPIYQNRIELLQGTLDMLVLRTLQSGPAHGYAISQSIRTNSSEAFQVETGSLYPALHRMQKQGWLASEWGQTDGNHRARYYRLTPTGRKKVVTEIAKWDRMVTAIAGILYPAGATA